jgi:hypothetical protein
MPPPAFEGIDAIETAEKLLRRSGQQDSASTTAAHPHQTTREISIGEATERVAKVRSAYDNARKAGPDVAAKGATRTLLIKCLGAAAAIIAVGLLVASTAGTALIVLAAVKAVVCVGDAYYARRVLEHHRAVASGNSSRIESNPLPPMGASCVANFCFDLAKLVRLSDQAARHFANAVKVSVMVGFTIVGFEVAGALLGVAEKVEDVTKIVDESCEAILHAGHLHDAVTQAHSGSERAGRAALAESLKGLDVHVAKFEKVTRPGALSNDEHWALIKAITADADARAALEALHEATGDLHGDHHYYVELRRQLQELVDNSKALAGPQEGQFFTRSNQVLCFVGYSLDVLGVV